MLKVKIIIEFEYEEEKICSWKIKQEGIETLDNENLIYLLQNIVGELAYA